MTIGVDVIRGILKLDNFMEGKCFTSWADFIAAMPSMFSVEVPTDVTNVKLGTDQPSDSERDNLWIKINGAGSFVGIFIYAQGTWQQIYPVPQEIFFMYGDSRNVPAGYRLVSDDPNISDIQVVNMQKIWTTGGTSPTWYTTFHVTYKGF